MRAHFLESHICTHVLVPCYYHTFEILNFHFHASLTTCTYVLFLVNTAFVLNILRTSIAQKNHRVCVCAGDLHVPGVVSTGGGEFAGVLHMDLSVGRQDVVPLYGQWYVRATIDSKIS